VQRLMQTFRRIAAVAVVGALAAAGTVQLAYGQATERKVKDQIEFDLYNQALKDAQNPTAQIKDIETWIEKYPESDWKDSRLPMLLNAYNQANQPAKVLELGGKWMDQGLKNLFKDPKESPQQIFTVLYLMTVNITKLPNATPEQTALGDKAARALQDYVSEYFTAGNKPAGVTDADWAKTKNDVASLSKNVLIDLANRPGYAALTRFTTSKNPADCVAAEAAYRKALEAYPDSAAFAYQLGRALRCQQTASPEKVPQAIYMFARAAALDPTLGGTMQPKALNDYLESAYKSVHGSTEGLDQLKAMAKTAVLPPAGFKIKTASEILAEQQEQFEKSNPVLAMWMKIKGALQDTAGEQYFEGSFKDAMSPTLRGTVLDGKPACRSKELMVGVRMPDQKGDLTTEFILKLDKALPGKPETGQEIEWKGVPKTFTKDPFLLTMEVETSDISPAVKTTPCAAAAPAKKAAPKKK
jgi:hypothetical protein